MIISYWSEVLMVVVIRSSFTVDLIIGERLHATVPKKRSLEFLDKYMEK